MAANWGLNSVYEVIPEYPALLYYDDFNGVDGIDLIVLLFRFADGRRRVVRIAEPYWTPEATVAFNDVFIFEHGGYDTARQVIGEFRRMGTTRFGETFRRLNIPLPDAMV